MANPVYAVRERNVLSDLAVKKTAAGYGRPGTTRYENKAFYDEIVDGATFEGLTFIRCSFLELGARSVTFRNCTFQACVFSFCYFKSLFFDTNSFIGSDFERCKFHSAKFHASVLDYTRFIECSLTPEQIQDNLPNNPSASYRLLRNLYEESSKIGAWTDLKQLYLMSVYEEERHWWRILTGYNEYYRKTFSIFDRFSSLFKFTFSRLSGFIWGHGQKSEILVRNLILFLVVFPAIVFVTLRREPRQAGEDIDGRGISDFFSNYLDYFEASLDIVMPFASLSVSVQASEIIRSTPVFTQALGSLVGLIFFGLFVSILHSNITRNNT